MLFIVTFSNWSWILLLEFLSAAFTIVNPKNVDKIYGKLDLKEDLEKVLDGISFISKTKYKKNGNKYEFYQ